MLTDEKNPVTEEEDDEVIVLQGPEAKRLNLKKSPTLRSASIFTSYCNPSNAPKIWGRTRPWCSRSFRAKKTTNSSWSTTMILSTKYSPNTIVCLKNNRVTDYR